MLVLYSGTFCDIFINKLYVLISMPQELFEIPSLDSLVGEPFSEQSEPFDLRLLEIPPYTIPQNRTIRQTTFPALPKEYSPLIRTFVEPVAQEAEQNGFNSNIFTALYEAVLNAHQHGNQLDPTKTVTLAYAIEEDMFCASIIDQGGRIDPAFVPFVLRHKLGEHKKKFIDFYQFSNKEKPKSNRGTGTSFMHTYVNQVNYYKSEEGGLVVELIKLKPE
ncbi:hypothetical protein D6774_03670 [Candidatus Woesearchaeota archaeon]|nr:MAG: hypothetical protein D6774_03670 [Candidatus Woesearchaeota archaeon]